MFLVIRVFAQATKTQASDEAASTLELVAAVADSAVAVATILLVVLTIVYVVLTRRVALANCEGVEVAREALVAERVHQARVLKALRRQHSQQLNVLERQHRVVLAQLLESVAPDVTLQPTVDRPQMWEARSTILGTMGVRPPPPTDHQIAIKVVNEGPTRVHVSVEAGVTGSGSGSMQFAGCRVRPGESGWAHVWLEHAEILQMLAGSRALWLEVVARPSLGGVEDRYQLRVEAAPADSVPAEEDFPGGVPSGLVTRKAAHAYLKSPHSYGAERTYPALGTTEKLPDSWWLAPPELEDDHADE